MTGRGFSTGPLELTRWKRLVIDRPRPISSISSERGSSSVTGGRVGAAVLAMDGRRFANGLLTVDEANGMIVDASDCAEVLEIAEFAVDGLPSLEERLR